MITDVGEQSSGRMSASKGDILSDAIRSSVVTAQAALAKYPIVVEVPIRWGDMDAFRHVNNTLFFRYFEVARVKYFDAIDFREGPRIGPILAATSCRFLKSLAYPDLVRVGARVTTVSNDRFTHEYVAASDRLQAVVAVGEGLVVSYDYERRAKAPLPADVRERIEELERPVPSEAGTNLEPEQD